MHVHVYMACSVDGYVARPDGDLSFLPLGGDQDFGMGAFLESIDVLIMGRATLETVLSWGQWPYAGMRVFAASGSLTESPHPAVTLVSGAPSDILESVGDAEVVWVDGPETARRFLAAGLVDTVTVTRVPVLLGDGIPFFGKLTDEVSLTLRSSTAYPGGVVQDVFRVAR